MARYKKKEGKNNASYAGKVPQEVEKEDNSRTLKSVAPEDIQHRCLILLCVYIYLREFRSTGGLVH